MFGNKQEPTVAPKGNNIVSSQVVSQVSKGTIVEGHISAEGDIRIDGKVKGIVSSKAKVVLGASAIVEGDVVCQNADISGKIIGKVEVKDLLFMKNTGSIDGDIVTNKIVVEAGANFNGTCSMGASGKVGGKITSSTTLKKEAV